MALDAVSSATSTIGGLLVEEAKYLWGVEREVERLEMELSWMQIFLRLKDADARQDQDERIRKWVAEIREIAYDAEDVVESFALKIKSKRKGGFFNVVKRLACILKESQLLHETRSNIEEILTRIVDLTRRLQTYGIKELPDVHRSSASSVRRERRQSYPFIEDHIVGLTKETKEVVALVTKDCQCRVASICGMGGLGKTTLAKKVYNHNDVRKEFTHFAWVYISQQFQKRNVWEQVLSSFNKMNDELRKKDQADIAKELSGFLTENKCLVILDDLWNPQDWNLLSPAFPAQNSRSKILVTSRNKEVGKEPNDGRSCCIYELQFLNEDDSWELFQKIAFRNISSNFPDYLKLKNLGKEMVNRCAGLPLAIIVLGGILTKYSSHQEWEKVNEHIGSYLKRDKERKFEDVLALSYDELPSYLRPCFLYLCHFPEDYEIPANKLIQLWVIEGFVSSELNGEESAEDIAESYLAELVERFMVQVGKRDATFRIKTCRMHDLMRDLCLSEAKEENFLHVMDSSSSKLSSRTVRRIVANRFPYVGINNVRSILFFDNESKEMRRVFKLQGSWKYIFNNFKLIRVLDFEGMRCLEKLPSDIGSLIHLRFLSFRGMHFSGDVELPSSVGNLTCLQTLDLRVGYKDIYVPNVLWRLEQLKHLYLPNYIWPIKHVRFKCSSKEEKLALHTLTKLQTLVNFNIGFCCAADLSQLTSLRELKITGWFFNIKSDFNKDSDGNYLIIKSKHLNSLSISLSYGTTVEPIDVALFLSSCPYLYKLSIKGVGRIVKLPEYHCFSSDIVKIVLYRCKLEEDPMPTLEKLPNLRILIIVWNGFIGKEMVCSPRGFPKLHSLILGLVVLEEWKVDEGAMPALRHLSIGNCHKLKKVPDGLKFITTLQELEIIGMPKEFKNKMEEVFHYVPSRIFHNIRENEQGEETTVTNEHSDQNEDDIVSTLND